MTNIPTDLLRTFVLVVELRSFTRAARAQDITQPAVSVRIRSLQEILGVELFDKSAPGVTLTAMGEQVIESARRLLSVNDEIVQFAGNGAAESVRVGVRKDWMGDELMHCWPRRGRAGRTCSLPCRAPASSGCCGISRKAKPTWW